MNRVLVAVMVLAFGACLPFPHLQQRTPRVLGVVERDGAPAGGVVVRYLPKSYGVDPCTSALATTSGDGGRFEFAAVKEFEFFWVFGDRLDTWGVCVEPDGGAPVRSERSMFWGGPPQVEVACSLGPDAGCNWRQ